MLADVLLRVFAVDLTSERAIAMFRDGIRADTTRDRNPSETGPASGRD
jgi:hypothetical protein